MASSPDFPARRPRHDGWTVERQEAFLTALAGCGCVAHAARSVGMSRQSANNLYNRPSAVGFRRAYDAALDCSLRLAEDGVWSRAINGVARPIFYKGEKVGEYRHFDERLTMFLLRHRWPHRYGDVPKPAPIVHPPGWDGPDPDPDEAVASLDFHLGDLVDEGEVPDSPGEAPWALEDGPADSEPEDFAPADVESPDPEVPASRAQGGVNFVNFVGNEEFGDPRDSSGQCPPPPPAGAGQPAPRDSSGGTFMFPTCSP